MSEHDDLDRAALAASTRPGARAALDALPWIGGAIADDRDAGLFARWGLSTVIDENLGTAVLPRALFDELHDRAGVAAEWPHGNAGVLHTYGYLLSLAPTPYGLKRERWLGTALSTALGLAPQALLPWRCGPSLLARATSAASTLLRSPAVESTCSVDGRASRVALSAAHGPAALAYEVAPAPGADPLLVTMFPVDDAEAALAGFEADPRVRWNAV
ncbi:amino acid deaminase [Microbacterium hydrocarbonoxydans]|uniref:amino acid deaminase n=1 Tax=Microbacterium hydrocarbonoxydans TaxID=273678 RepID=UPI002041E79D|nr:amino acid deaminase [Microbacterium hydrocarbonoxydans]MCM3779934.1 amino acid deaminase [Microbacterium hydrocarbonoxydans]